MYDDYIELANAIILLAVKDYRKALRALAEYPDDSDNQLKKREVERFFRSKWFGMLTQLDPQTLISQLKLEVI